MNTRIGLLLGWAMLALANGASGTTPSPWPGISAAKTQTMSGDGWRAEFAMRGETANGFGFIPFLVTIHNLQPAERRMTIEFSAESPLYRSDQDRFTQTFSIPADRTSTYWVYLPQNTPLRYGWGGGAQVRARFEGPGMASSGPEVVGYYSTEKTTWAVGTSLVNSVTNRLSAARSLSGARREELEWRMQVGVLPMAPEQLPQDWRGWSSFSRVILRASEFEAMPASARAALDNWVALGGHVYLSPTGMGERSARAHGAGTVETLAAPIQYSEIESNQGIFDPQEYMSDLEMVTAGRLNPESSDLAKTLPTPQGAGDWLAVFFVVFAVVVGPVNLYAIAPARRRHRLFVTVPLISLVAFAGLALAIAIRDGFGGRGVRRTLVVLMPEENQAAIIQEQVSITGLLRSSGFALADDTACTQFDLSNAARYGMGSRRAEFQRGNGWASGDWFRSRSRQAQHLRRMTPTRARVEQVGTDPTGAPIIQSSIGSALSDFRYVDEAGRIWQARELAPGAKVTLSPAPDGTGLEDIARRFGRVGSDGFYQLVSHAVSDSAPLHHSKTMGGRFIGFAQASNLAPLATLDSIHWQDSQVLHTGLIENRAVPRKVDP